MPKQLSIRVKESESFLKKEYRKTTSLLKKSRIKTLLYIAQGRYFYQSDIAKKIGKTEKTIREWLKTYERDGFTRLLEVKSGGNNTRTISDKAINFIEEKVNDSSTTITSYVEFQQLISKELNEEVAYGALYSHCRRKHKTKLKVSRKSHYKKNKDAEILFKNAKKSI